MTQLLVVFGATGQQGSSVINHVLSDPVLSSKYFLRGVTRDVTKPAAQDLQKKGVEVVPGNLDDPASIHAALRGAHTVFAMTRTVYDEQAQARDERQGKTIADAAIASGAQYLIWSSSVHAGNTSGGKYPVPAYDAHYNVEQYIRGLPIRSAFVAPGTFMQNLRGMMWPRPREDGSYVIANIHSPQARFPWLDVEADMGKFVGVVLAEPEKYQGKVLAASSCIHSFEEVVRILSAVSGKTMKYVEMPEAKFREFCPPAGADAIVNMFWFIQEFGYYGAETEKVVEWSVQQVNMEDFAKTIQFA
ncbi:hypothetical protein Aspvir_004383 [Aspergillus viridinutans]|uniref:NmrA-like domain-containing protein n=1 Tax=Aspergillus viridinutans TaxID=75553 RepID=A0A9P3BQC2_ASPVI|nr:uncharacterized protein Aspvir_004383 [Aspergillus viridinutans]GIK00360.1 hypothetical protein Aspvir_004383 [Aspergillus viridinutans]